MIDLHVHTELCRHAEGLPAAYVSAARRRGVDVLAFTDHLPLLDSDDTHYAMSRAELPEYVEAVLAAAAEAPLKVLLGIEADWFAGREADTAELLDLHDFDLVLGSIHFIDDWAFDDPRERHRIAEWDVRALWERYFEEFTAAARSGLFDVMAHPDLVKKFGWRPSEDPVDLYSEAARALAECDVTVEVSTAGLRKPVGEIYPSESFLRACRSAGVPVTIGSDAHSPQEVGFAFDEAVALVKRVGYDRVALFEARTRTEVEL